MDLKGQQLAERLYVWIMILFGIIGFIYGYIQKSTTDMMNVFLLGVAIAVFISCPDWPFFNNNPNTFLKISILSY